MGKVSIISIFIMVLLLATSAYLVHGPLSEPVDSVSVIKPPLSVTFANIYGWESQGLLTLDDQIVKGLNLDDYLFRSYKKGNDSVTLYIGYYRTAAKVGAAHDPTVCFYGQGWYIKDSKRETFSLRANPTLKVNFSSMSAERLSDRELVIYWFQTNGAACSNTFEQKIYMVRDRFRGLGGENAFIRITTPILDGRMDEARNRIFSFVESFYPEFHRYVKGS
jgi:EpsI family protein